MFDSASWKLERNKNAQMNEGISEEEIQRYWDSASDNCPKIFLTDFMNKVLDLLFDIGSMGSEDTILDIGSGPGSYALEMSKRVKHVTCLDSTPGMLKIVDKRCKENNVNNVSTILEDWRKYVPKSVYDVAFTSMCPVTNNPESLEKMEKCATRKCIYLSVLHNEGDSIQRKVWKALGKDYSSNSNDSRYILNYLKEEGRNARLDTLTREKRTTVGVEDMIQRELNSFKIYKYDELKLDAIIRSIVEPMSKNGILELDENLCVGIITWSPPKHE